MNPFQVIVVGAGPSGLTAAGRAAELGAKVVLVEKNTRPGVKLSITGKGRCNLTNIAPLEDFLGHFGKNGQFLRQAFDRFFSEDLLCLLEGLGVKTVCERGGRIFPSSEQASDIVGALLRWIENSGVAIWPRTKVTRLEAQSGKLSALEIDGPNGRKTLAADTVILATGGMTYPGTGSTGDGYGFAKAVGHTIVPVRPALVSLETAGGTASRLQGVSLKNVLISVVVDGKREAEEFGEMLFTHFGLSGPAVLSLSRRVVDALLAKKPAALSIDLKPALDEQKLDARLLRDIREHPGLHAKNLFRQLLPQKLIPVCLEITEIDPDKPAHQISAVERKRLLKWLKNFRFNVKAARPMSEAIVTAGGVHLKEVNPRTMESLKIKGLHFAGEILDLDADTGGYNLQAAFSTGWAAGEAAARAALAQIARSA
jgi:predicted Rossmann fold flavoprotein